MSARSTERAEGKEEISSEQETKSDEEEETEEVVRETASPASRRKLIPPQQSLPKIPEEVDDFLRNFLRRTGLSRTLCSFEKEWYSSDQELQRHVFFIPDAHTHRALLENELEAVHRETEQLRQQVLDAGKSLVTVQRQRHFHCLQHQQVAESKKTLLEELKQLREHLQSCEPLLRQVRIKYKAAVMNKMLISLQHKRAQKAVHKAKRKQGERSTAMSDSTENSPPAGSRSTRSKPSQFTTWKALMTSHLTYVDFEKWKTPDSLRLAYTSKAHKLPISCIDLHPRKWILASASNDCSWKLWEMPARGKKVAHMILTGEGHSDWLSGCRFHPSESKLATTSGDTTVRLWDTSLGCCVSVLSGHSKATLACSFDSCGLLLASCSTDCTVKLWDVSRQRCRLTLRRHTASVNSVCFLPRSNTLLTCSADRTVAMWDSRVGVSIAVLCGHQHPCSSIRCSPMDYTMASCDLHGTIKLWDPRKPNRAVASVDTGPQANQLAFSPCGRMLAVACSDGLLRLLQVNSCVVSTLPQHSSGSMLSVVFDHQGETVLSADRDGMIHVWS